MMRPALKFLLIVAILATPCAFAQDFPFEDTGTEPEAGAGSVIETRPDQFQSDEHIQSRLEAIFERVPDLTTIAVSVDDGVVELAGIVDNAGVREQAEKLAWRVEGVAVVVNRLDIDRGLKSRLEAASRDLLEQARDLVALAPVLILALLAIGAAIILARLVGRADWIYTRITKNWFLRDLWRQVFQLFVVAIGLLFALSLLDATALVGSLLGALGILGLAIGFATRDTVENYIASILLSIRQPFRREDHVLINDVEGKVIRLTPRATILMSLSGNHIRIPNASVFKATIVNFTRNPLRRLEFTVGVDTDLDLIHPRQIAIQTLERIPGILSDPEPLCLIDALGDSSVILKIQAWVDQRESDFFKSRSEAQRLVKDAFDEAGIVMPEPIYNVNLRRTKPADKLRATRPHPASEQPPADTAVDRAVDDQIRQESATQNDGDLLDEKAPVE